MLEQSQPSCLVGSKRNHDPLSNDSLEPVFDRVTKHQNTVPWLSDTRDNCHGLPVETPLEYYRRPDVIEAVRSGGKLTEHSLLTRPEWVSR